MVPDPLQTPGALNWNPAIVGLPEVPTLPPGEDAMSMTISAALPMLGAPLAADVAALQEKEAMFSGKLGSAQAAYQNADDSGQQEVGQLTSQLGQIGQMGQQIGQQAGQAGGGGGMFGSLMQPAMQAMQSFQGKGAGGGGDAMGQQGAGAPGGGGMGAAGAPGQSNTQAQQQDSATRAPEKGESHEDRGQEREHEPQRSTHHEQVPLKHAEGAGAGPSTSGPQHAGPAPVSPPERHGGGEDLTRRM